MKLQARVMLAAAAAITLTTASIIAIVYQLSSRNRVAELRGKMSSIISQSELMAKNLNEMHRSHVFDMAGLVQAARDQAQGRPIGEIYETTDLYKTIPIIVAWKSVEGAAARNGFNFCTPSRPGVAARNPGRGTGTSEGNGGLPRGLRQAPFPT